MEQRDSGSARKVVRGIALYYGMVGNRSLESAALARREAGVAKRRAPLKLKAFRGVSQRHLRQLATAGITDVEQMLASGSTPAQRERLAGEHEVPLPAVLELVKLSDLARIPGIRGIRARLYHDAGADTAEKLATWDPEELRAMLAAYVQRTGFQGTAPLPKEVSNTVNKARSLPRCVEF